ncbi:NADH:flavorubredoxin reductase NorW [Photobacterium lipolyticum]|uniref:NADH:flavorubredoxin reductase NorW n=1 Tax=Photobacterium lipolyticum TaxID=266810 RepID=A0A2T3MUK7_9GAMM|nr:NADH:flavorubredoxin reductase NorW [Photobacterium lipolyticum]PSW03648.1 NADH:flavorubredoxin reductase NorW [Photobacterium lipolyticum]
MDKHIVIIGSGFAAYQLVKSLRKLNADTPITVITADSGNEYSKPEISHVFSKQQTANDLIRQSACEFAADNNILLINNTLIESIDTDSQTVHYGDNAITYSELVLATGASALVPAFAGNAIDEIVTLNSLTEYEQQQDKLACAKSVLVLGAGLIGTEIAMDLASSGKSVTLCDRASSLMPTLLPPFISAGLFQEMHGKGVQIRLNSNVTAINRHHQELVVSLSGSEHIKTDAVIAAMGLKPNIGLAKKTGIETDRGITVDRIMQTSASNVYALGDCAELEGKVRAFIQPAMLSAMALAKTLLGSPTPVRLPASLIKAKTPWLPLHMSGNTVRKDLSWEVVTESNGLIAKAFDKETAQLVGFVVSHDQHKAAFPLLRLLPAE